MGSRVSLYDLANQTARTIRAQGRSDLALIALSPDQQVLLQVDVEGYAQIVLLRNDSVLAYLNFHGPLSHASFSDDGKYLAVALGGKLKIFECAFYNKKNTGTLLPHLNFSAWHAEDILHFNWYGEYLITSSADMTVRLCNVTKREGYIPITLTGHRKPVLGAFPYDKYIYTVSSDARVFVWQWAEADDKFLARQEAEYNRRTGKVAKLHSNTDQLVLIHKHQLQHEGSFILSSASMKGKLLVVGFKSGNFALYSISEKEAQPLHTLHMSDYEISSIAINNTAEWIAFASQAMGQLLVWEWKSETYVIRQMGHSSELMSVAYSPDGTVIATGGIDGKVKLWDKGLCYATFTEHSSGVVALAFTKSQAVVSASSDGTVRAYDIVRYRQFRVMTTPTPVSFMCLAIDNSGEIVCAGADDYEIYVWAMNTGQLCDKLSGHTGPVSCMAFSPLNALYSGSWDKTVRMWDVFESKGASEALEHPYEVLTLTIRQDGRQLATSLNNGDIYLWQIPENEEIATLEGRRDIAGGRGAYDRITAKHNPSNKQFNSLAYSPDGNMILAAGQSKYACLYELKHKVLLHRFSFTENRSLSGVLSKLNSKNMTDAGPVTELEVDEYSAHNSFNEQGIPDAYRPGDMLRKPRRQVKVTSVSFSPHGREFSLVTTEGLLVYSLDEQERFLPLALGKDVSKPAVIASLIREEYSVALILSLKLSEEDLIKDVFYRIPDDQVSSVVQNLKGRELLSFIRFLNREVEKSLELGLILNWTQQIVKWHSRILKGISEIKPLIRGLSVQYKKLSWMCRDNTYLLNYLSN